MGDTEEMDTFQDHTPKIRAGDVSCRKIRKLKVIKAYHKFVHACTCTNPDCENAGCDEMKSTVVHFKMCTRRPKKDCTSCRQLLALCRYHAKRSHDCESKQCIVPYCAKMKHLLKLKRKAKRAARRAKEAVVASTSPTEPNEEWEVNSISDSDGDSVVVVSPEEVQQQQESEVAQPSTNLGLAQVGFTPYSNTTTTSSAPSVLLENYTLPTVTSPAEIDNTPPQLPFLDDPQSEAQLKMLLRAHKCLTEESQGVAAWPCFESNCGVMKQVLKHIYSCRIGTICTVLHCRSSKALLNHWNNCRNAECQLCIRVRASQGRYDATGVPFVARTESSEIGELTTHVNKDWQRSIYPGVREQMVKKIIGIVPLYVRASSSDDPRLRNLITYAKQAEAAMFNKANSNEEYFRLVYEASHRVQEEMRRKWNLRRRNHSAGTNSNNPEVPIETLEHGAQPADSTSNQIQREEFRRLGATGTPDTLEEQRELLRRLKFNPQLMTDFIRGRQVRAAFAHLREQWNYNSDT